MFSAAHANKRVLLAISIFAATFVCFEILTFVSGYWSTFYFTLAKSIVCVVIAGYLLDIFGAKILTTTVDSKGKAVFITGCDSGFGHELAKRLDLRGFKVFAGCFSPNKGGAIQLQETCSQHLQIVPLDVTKDDSVNLAKEIVKNNLGTHELWAIVNNAGIFRGLNIEVCSMDHYETCMEVNAMGPVRVTKAFLPLLRKSKGRVINVNSLAGRYSVPYMAAYSMSKYASLCFTECLKQEMHRFGVTVISIEPEFFQTSLVVNETISMLHQEGMEELDDQIKKEYGEKFLSRTKKLVENIFKNSSPKYHIVINAMENAVSAEYPASVYKPCRNWLVKTAMYFGEHMPKGLIQAINKTYV